MVHKVKSLHITELFYVKTNASELNNRVEKARTNSLYAELLLRYLACKILKIPNNQVILKRNLFDKPYLMNYNNFFFNISHSEDFVICVVSSNEVGADIQKVKPTLIEITKKLYNLSNKTENLDEFYNRWVKEESYIKYLGKNMKFLVKAVPYLKKDVCFKQYDIHPDYKISVCSKENTFSENIFSVDKKMLDDFFNLNRGYIKGKL
jgi:4'-phosphopantetheinyl transferase